MNASMSNNTWLYHGISLLYYNQWCMPLCSSIVFAQCELHNYALTEKCLSSNGATCQYEISCETWKFHHGNLLPVKKTCMEMSAYHTHSSFWLV